MIKINNKEYHDYEIKITWGNFDVCSNGKKNSGLAPFIEFNIENNIFLGLEFIFSREMFENTKLNITTNIDKYISDITYEDKDGWISLILEKYNCSITRMNENTFKIEFYVESKEIEELNIIINANIKIL